MRKRKPKNALKDAIEDADAALRTLSRRFPEGFAQVVLRKGERIESAEWLETQVAARPLRLDRVLYVRLVGGRQRLLHGEWTERLNRRERRRFGEYHLTAATAERIDTEVASKFGLRKKMLRPLETVVVVLRGRKKKWPEHGVYRTSDKRAKFCGVQFRIEPVYQRTVAELEAKGSVFWLAFVPLAIDVDEEKLRGIIERLRQQCESDDFDELTTTMLSMAKLKKDAPTFQDVIRSASSKEVHMNPWVRDALEQGLAKGMGPITYLFERQLGRAITASERRRLELRLEKDGPVKLGAVVLDLNREQLAAWLAPRKSSKRIA